MHARNPRRRLRIFLALLAAIPPQTSVHAGDLIRKVKAKWDNHQGVPSAEALAREIQKLEKHVDAHGTIVAKQPDVWGQSRLMKHRQEFERILYAELANFQEKINGSISRSDQAYFATAFSLSAAISGTPAIQMPQTAATSREVANRRRAELKAQGVDNPTPSQFSTPTTIPIPTSNASADQIDKVDDVIKRNPTKLDAGVGFASGTTIGLEPTEHLDQLARYVNHLQEIRRINEGDDTVASPGYALHLVRIPVSILPGSKTRKGYGAEITITATPYLGRDLLPTTFRNLVVNDLVEQVATPLTHYFNSPKALKAFRSVKDSIRAGNAFVENRKAVEAAARAHAGGLRTVETAPPAGSDPAFRRAAQVSLPPLPPSAAIRADKSTEQTDFYRAYLRKMRSLDARLLEAMHPAAASIADESYNPAPEGKRSLTGQICESMSLQIGVTLGSSIVAPQLIPPGRSRNARFAFPATQMVEVYGPEAILPVAYQAFDALLAGPIAEGDDAQVLQFHRVASYVQDQVTAAYDFLSREENAPLWLETATSELARAVQSRDAAMLKSLRTRFFSRLPNQGIDAGSPYRLPEAPFLTTTAAIAWGIMVESALLNERLIQDVKESASAKGAAPIMADGRCFFLPCPSDEEREIFNAYVRTRFPIHVFALDPVVQEQNIADQLSRSREMQLALSLAFVTGNISASNMTRMARRLEYQTATIALNRTQIAFSHGEDTFGWRFQPRHQTPPTPGTARVLAETILGGPSREADRAQLELEPGARECTALVIMPSFVPYVSFETRSNWYRLNSPKHGEIDALKFLELSASIKKAYELARMVCDSGMYREGDVGRLVNRVKQLAAEMPMQSMIQQVPHENTHGGFELFNVGITDLAPELRSWYGAPGVNLQNGTSLYLVGDNYSIHETSVVIGNKLLSTPDVSLLSRQVMRVNVPAGVQPVMRSGVQYVEASVATPYGVSQSLYLPVYPSAAAVAVSKPKVRAPRFNWSPTSMTLTYRFVNQGISAPPAGAELAVRPPKRLMVALDSGVDLTPTLADVKLIFDAPFDAVAPINLTDVPFNSTSGAFEIADDKYKLLIDEIHKRFAMVFSKDSPPGPVSVGRTIIRLKGTRGPVIPQDVENELRIEWSSETEPK